MQPWKLGRVAKFDGSSAPYESISMFGSFGPISDRLQGVA